MKVSAHFGLNCVDPAAYGGWPGELAGCHNDAANLATLAAAHGFTGQAWFDADCSRVNFEGAILHAAEVLQPGDSFLLSYSGHGGQVPDLSEADRLAETFCLFDGNRPANTT